MNIAKKIKRPGNRAQAIVEFAIVMPILMMILVGIFEAGRMAYIYTAVTNASREASRYGSAVGLERDPDDLNLYSKYSYCKGIRSMARRSAYFLNLPDSSITIEYVNSAGSVFDNCPAGVIADTTVSVNTGTSLDRVKVTVTATYRPLIRLIPIRTRTINSSSARTILGIFDLGS
jgi:Flp pilus assembly protein TadG